MHYNCRFACNIRYRYEIRTLSFSQKKLCHISIYKLFESIKENIPQIYFITTLDTSISQH